jgi:hypothetical protein
MRNHIPGWALLALFGATGCDSTTQPGPEGGAGPLSFTTKTDSTFLAGLLLVSVRIAPPAGAGPVCYSFTGSATAEAGTTRDVCHANPTAETILFPIVRPASGSKTVSLAAEISKGKVAADGSITPDHSNVIATRDSTFDVAPQPLAAGVTLIPVSDTLRGSPIFAYSAKRHSIAIADGDHVRVLDLNDRSLREVYARRSGAFLHATTSVTPDGDSMVYEGPAPFGAVALSFQPLWVPGPARTTAYFDIGERRLFAGPLVTSNGRAFMFMVCTFPPACAGIPIAEYDMRLNQWRVRNDAGLLAYLGPTSVSGSGNRWIAFGKTSLNDCCVTYDVQTDAFTTVTNALPQSDVPFDAGLMLNYDGSLLMYQNRIWDAKFALKADFSTWYASGFFTPVWTPENEIVFSAPRGAVVADALTGKLLRGINLGLNSPRRWNTAIFVAPDPSRTLVVVGDDTIGVVSLRN